MTIHDEIKNALEKLGYKEPQFRVVGEDPVRYVVYLNGKKFGIWDTVKKTFVD